MDINIARLIRASRTFYRGMDKTFYASLVYEYILKNHRIPDTQSRVITKVHDLRGQSSYISSSAVKNQYFLQVRSTSENADIFTVFFYECIAKWNILVFTAPHKMK